MKQLSEHRPRILEMARNGMPPSEIARHVPLSHQTVSHYICEARRNGDESIPIFQPGRPAKSGYYIALDPNTAAKLKRIANRRGMTRKALLGLLIEIIAADDLADAVLDDGGDV